MEIKEKARRSEPLPKHVLADGSDLTHSLPPIQSDPAAELAFACQLATIVFGKPPQPFVVDHKRRRLMRRVPA